MSESARYQAAQDANEKWYVRDVVRGSRSGTTSYASEEKAQAAADRSNEILDKNPDLLNKIAGKLGGPPPRAKSRKTRRTYQITIEVTEWKE